MNFNIYLDDVEDWGIDMLEVAAKGVQAKTAHAGRTGSV